MVGPEVAAAAAQQALEVLLDDEPPADKSEAAGEMREFISSGQQQRIQNDLCTIKREDSSYCYLILERITFQLQSYASTQSAEMEARSHWLSC